MSNWLFYSESKQVASLWRVLVMINVLAVYYLFHPLIDVLLTNQAIVSVDEITNLYTQRQFSLFFYIQNPFLVRTIYYLGILSGVFVLIGLAPRIAAICCFTVFISILNRFPLLDFGGSMMLSPCLFALIFLSTSTSNNKVPGWPLRFIQVYLCIAYFFSGISKLRSPQWLSGEVMALIMNSEQSLFTLTYLGESPIVSMILTYLPIIFELGFPLLVWFAPLRRVLVVSMFMMHFSIFFLLHVTVMFTETFMVLLCAFLTQQDIELFNKLKSKIFSVKKESHVSA